MFKDVACEMHGDHFPDGGGGGGGGWFAVIVCNIVYRGIWPGQVLTDSKPLTAHNAVF